jgi:hypothetical protein
MLVSTFRGCFLAHSMHVVTPGKASRRCGEIGLLQSPQSFRLDSLFSDLFMVDYASA